MIQSFLVFIIAGMMLIGAEIFVPGGVLGVIGALSLVIAGILGFTIFPPGIAAMIAVGMIGLVGIVMLLWIRIFPRTAIGRQMTDSLDLKDAKSADDSLVILVGKTGITRSPLRPSGFVEIDNRRIDVMTQGEMIDTDRPVRVTSVEGNRVIVEAAPAPIS